MRSTRGNRGRGLAKTIDWKLVICYLLLILFGWINIYASIQSGESTSLFDFGNRSGKQFVWIITSLGLATVILFAIKPHIYEGLALPIYGFTILLLISVIFFGIEVKGSRSWFEFGPVRFQPAEISKIATSLLLAKFMSQLGYKISRLKDFLITAAIIGLPILIILMQSETGSALVFMGFIFMLYREGLSGWLIFMLGVAILLFITTLTSSPYTAILILASITSFCIMLYSGKARTWLMAGVPVIMLLAFTPKIIDTIAEKEIAAHEAAVENVTAQGDSEAQEETAVNDTEKSEETTEDSAPFRLSFIARIKPLHILFILLGIAVPWVSYRAFRERNTFAQLAIVASIAGLIIIFSTSFLFNDVLQDHQRKRIEVLLGMKDDPSGVGYNVNQSKIAIGSGGLFGKGFLNGTQTTFGFVPEQSTDFIFCTVGEEWGFVGCTFVILLYVFMIIRIIKDAEKSREAFTRIYGYCVACCIFMHLFINVGMTIGMMPVIGIPLPLMSYGGSSLWSFTIMIFIFIALDRNDRKYF